MKLAGLGGFPNVETTDLVSNRVYLIVGIEIGGPNNHRETVRNLLGIACGKRCHVDS